MEYSNPKIPEEINYSKENPLKEFFLLVAGIFLVIIVFVTSVHILAQHFAHHIPFKYETLITPESWITQQFSAGNDSKKQEYLSLLTERLTQKMDIPNDIQLTIFYSDSEEINAFATLNGTIIITDGLLNFVESENELAFVIAHEIAHIKKRHPIKSLGSSVLVGITMAIIGGSVNSDGATTALMTGTTLTSLNFSRRQESQADMIATRAIFQVYGSTLGSSDFFNRLNTTKNMPKIAEFLSTHPNHEHRIENIRVFSKSLGENKTDAVLTPLPLFKDKNHED